MDRRNRGEVLFYALQCAKLDRLSMADCWEKGHAEYNEAHSDIKMFERLQIELFGTCENALNQELENMPLVSITEIRKFIKEQP